MGEEARGGCQMLEALGWDRSDLELTVVLVVFLMSVLSLSIFIWYFDPCSATIIFSRWLSFAIFLSPVSYCVWVVRDRPYIPSTIDLLHHTPGCVPLASSLIFFSPFLCWVSWLTSTYLPSFLFQKLLHLAINMLTVFCHYQSIPPFYLSENPKVPSHQKERSGMDFLFPLFKPTFMGYSVHSLFHCQVEILFPFDRWENRDW